MESPSRPASTVTGPQLWIENARRFAVRVLRADLAREGAAPDERAALGSRGESELTANYLAWRRAMLWISGCALTLTAALGVSDWIGTLTATPAEMAESLGLQAVDERLMTSLVDIDQALSTVLFLPTVIAAWFVIRAALRWTDVGPSIRSARIGWMVLFGVPLAASMMPWNAAIEGMADMGAEVEAQMQQFRSGIGLMIALALFMKIGPAVIGLCGGIVRSSMTVKTLLPESPLPGWAAVAFGPIYGLLLVVVMVIVLQTSGSPLIVLALAALVASPLTYLQKWRAVLRAHSSDEVSGVVLPIRDRASLLNLVGVVLLATFLMTSSNFTWLQALTFLAAAVSSMMLMTLVAGDMLVVLIGASWQQTQSLGSSELAARLDAKLAELDRHGIDTGRPGAVAGDLAASV